MSMALGLMFVITSVITIGNIFCLFGADTDEKRNFHTIMLWVLIAVMWVLHANSKLDDINEKIDKLDQIEKIDK